MVAEIVDRNVVVFPGSHFRIRRPENRTGTFDLEPSSSSQHPQAEGHGHKLSGGDL